MYLRYKGEVNKVMAEYKVDIIDSAGKERESFKITTRDYQLEWLYGKPKWLKRNKLNDDLLPDGNLTIQCKVTFFGPEKILSANSNLFIHCQKQIGEDLEQVFSDKQFSDIKIQWEGQSFDCHMAILAARIPVFMAMFQSNMKEKQTHTVNIDDCRAGVVDKMLNFIYNVSSPDAISEIRSELFEVADKYQLDLMKEICEESLSLT